MARQRVGRERMNIIDIPMTDYLKYCKDVVSTQGYRWVMVLLARELDAKKSFNELRENWDSFDDITSNNILFVFTVARQKLNIDYDANGITDDCFGVITSPGLTLFNGGNLLHIKRHLFGIERLRRYQNKAINNHSNIISSLCKEYHLDESQVPSILLFNVENDITHPFVIPIFEDDLYGTIKELLIYTKHEMEQYDTCLNKLHTLRSEMCLLHCPSYSEQEKGFIKAKKIWKMFSNIYRLG